MTLRRALGPFGLLAEDLVAVVEGIGEGDGREEAGQEVGEARRDDQPAGEEGGDPLPKAEGSGDEFLDRQPPPPAGAAPR